MDSGNELVWDASDISIEKFRGILNKISMSGAVKPELLRQEVPQFDSNWVSHNRSQPGKVAPDAIAYLPLGDTQPVHLSDFFKLNRRSLKTFNEIARTYSAKDVTFVTVYIEEAHASDGWAMKAENEDIGICFKQPKTLNERLNVVREFQKNYELEGHLLVDDITNELSSLYEAKPERLYIVDDGKVKFRGGVGPFFYQLDQLELALKELCRPQGNRLTGASKF